MSVSVKKMQLYPLGDKEERDRVFKYLRDGIYNQHHILNTYMSQMGCLYYKYDKDIKNEDYKEEVKAIFRNTNTAIHDLPQAKGLGMSGNCGMRVKSDFRTALKNGLAKGERKLPFYKRDFPLLAPSRFLRFYISSEEYETEDGEVKEREVYCIKFVNGIHFKVILGSRGKYDYYLPSLLDSILSEPEKYRVCDSSIQITKKGKIILNLTTKINKEKEDYKPQKDKVMGLSMGYDKCLVAAFSDDDNVYAIGDDIRDSIVEKRVKIQAYNQRLQHDLKNAQGSHGRKRKLRTYDDGKHYEKNVVRHYNHLLSKQVVDVAKKNKAETIVIEDLNKELLKDYPILLRNWSYFQLVNFITYKAGLYGIEVVTSESKDASRSACCKCGCKLEDENIIPQKIEWCHELSFVCPNCKEQIEYSYNKAKNMTVMG